MSKARLTALGQCGFLLDTGKTRIVTDPFLSDSVDRMFYSEKTPWKRRYAPPCTLAALKPDAVVISHSHTDHMDPWTLGPYAKEDGSALILAPAPECAPLTEWGLKHIHPARAEEEVFVGEVRILPIPCAHTELHRDERGDFRELSYFLCFGDQKIFFGGDMSLYPGLEERLAKEKPTLLLLPCNGADEKRTELGVIGNIGHREACALSASLRVPFIPMHHDLYDFNGCAEDVILAEAEKTGAVCLPLHAGETRETGNDR